VAPDTQRLAVIGLGYVGLPLAVEFGRKFPVVGYDIDETRIDELRCGTDRTLEVAPEDLAAATDLAYSADPACLDTANVYIVTAPTPIDSHNQPDLGPLRSATRTVAEHMGPGDLVIYESTVFPGATEERCVPLLAEVSGLTYNEEFFVGYSPERINPGDHEHRLPTIVKVTSGSTPEAAERVDALYRQIITAGTHRAPSIKAAEAAKVIENTQRDVNIALVNELAILFDKLGIDTESVLLAAGTKWNFLNFRPGLVGGHCIGVDPYYLTYKAHEVGHNPELILAGRRLNDNMGLFVSSQLVKKLTKEGKRVPGSRCLVLGLTFKENTPDIRNTKIVDVIRELQDYEVQVDVHDPWADPATARAAYGISLVAEPEEGAYDSVIIAVAHRQFAAMGAEGIRRYGKPGDHVLFDLKYVLRPDEADLRL
jgi:UDP-N-acetyl-D-glucosamine/UDP-N-acetyl-D-galactosamine dehydrogenase